MKNVKIDTKNGKINIVIDPAKDFGPSKSGKTIVIATTQGNQTIEVGGKQVVLGVNAYRYAEPKKTD